MCKVSLIIPVYNAALYIKQCLDSILCQTLQEIEIICIDDCSTDDSVKIVEEYIEANSFSYIKLIRQKEKKGPGMSRNTGINSASGEYIAFIDADDFYPNKYILEKLYIIAKKYSANICGGGCILFRNDMYVLEKDVKPKEYNFLSDGFVEFSDYQFPYGYWRFIYSSSFLKDNDIKFPNYLRYQDPVFFISAMIYAKKFYAINEPTYVYRQGHKKNIYTEEQIFDWLDGINDCLMLSRINNFKQLYSFFIKKIITFVIPTNIFAINNSSVIKSQLDKVLDSIDINMIESNSMQTNIRFIIKLFSIDNVKISKQDLKKLTNIKARNYIKHCLILKYLFISKFNKLRKTQKD